MPEKIKAFFEFIKEKASQFWNGAKEWTISWWRDLCPAKDSKAEESSQDETAALQEPKTQDEQPKQESAPKQEQQHYAAAPKSVSATPIFHFFDMLASLCFFAALVIALKPELLGELAIKYYINTTGIAEVLTKIVCLDFSFLKEIAENLLLIRNLFVVCAIASFVLLKLISLLATVSPLKIVSVLLLALSVLTCVFVKEHFALFTLFILLLYLTFQFACGVRAKVIFNKLIALLQLFIVEYFALHLIFISNLRESFALPTITL